MFGWRHSRMILHSRSKYLRTCLSVLPSFDTYIVLGRRVDLLDGYVDAKVLTWGT